MWQFPIFTHGQCLPLPSGYMYIIKTRTSTQIQSMWRALIESFTRPSCQTIPIRNHIVISLPFPETIRLKNQASSTHSHIASTNCLGRLCGWVGVHLSLATSHCDIDESSCVCYSLLSTTLWCLLLFLRLDLWGLRLDFAGTSERSVNLTHDC